jgi:Predicted membrane protein (DUF2306)
MEEKMLGVLHRTAWVLVTIGALLMFLLAARYFLLDLDAAAANPDEIILRELYLERPLGLYIHAFAIMFPLIIGPVQFFLRRLTPEARRAKYLPLHRWLGRIYVTGALIGGLAGLYLAIFAFGGFVSALGFGLLAVLLLTSTSIAYLRIRAGDEFSHKEWMTRSYALMFAAVTLRLQLGIYEGAFGIEAMAAYQAVAWSSWVPNLIVAEIINTRRRQTEAPVSV